MEKPTAERHSSLVATFSPFGEMILQGTLAPRAGFEPATRRLTVVEQRLLLVCLDDAQYTAKRCSTMRLTIRRSVIDEHRVPPKMSETPHKIPTQARGPAARCASPQHLRWRQLEQSLTIYDRGEHHSLAFLMGGEELEVVCRQRLAVTLWCFGHPAQSLKKMNEAFTIAQELKSLFNIAFARAFGAIIR
jgi:hypothetical protein